MGRNVAIILEVKPWPVVVGRMMVGLDPHAGSQAHVAGLLAVVPRPQSKERERWVGEKGVSSLMAGMDM